jgi:hypothetical protein
LAILLQNCGGSLGDTGSLAIASSSFVASVNRSAIVESGSVFAQTIPPDSTPLTRLPYIAKADLGDNCLSDHWAAFGRAEEATPEALCVYVTLDA